MGTESSPGSPGEARSFYEYQIEYDWFDPALEEWVKGASYRLSEGPPHWLGPDHTVESRRMQVLSLLFNEVSEMSEKGNVREIHLFRRLVTHNPWDEVFGEQTLQKSKNDSPLGSGL